MFTPTLGEINTAIRTNNRKKAAAMLQTLIQEKPSADAWYLAAKLTNDRHKKIQFLRTAIVLKPNHYKSLEYLRDLGEDTGSLSHVLLTNVIYTFQEQVNNSPLLRNLSSGTRMTIGVSLLVIVVFIVGFFISTLLSLRGPSVSLEGPTEPSMQYIMQDDVLNHFNNGNLDIMFMNQARDNNVGKDIIQLDIRDVGNRSREVTIFIYDSVTSILADQGALDMYEQSANIIAHANIVVMYPFDISEISVASISDILDTMKK